MVAPQETFPLERDRSEYLSALLAGNADRASSTIQRLFTSGIPAKRVMIEIIAATQIELGKLWHEKEITIAHEHIATEISLTQLSWLRFHAPRRAPLNLKALVTVPPEEQHILPARLVADLLMLDGWEVHFPGRNTPANDLVEFITTTQVDLVAFSLTVEPQQSLVTLLKRIKKLTPAPLIAVGGQSAQSLKEAAEVDLFSPSSIEEIKLNPRFLGPNPEEAGFNQLKSSLGARITSLRQERKMSQQRLAEEAQIDRAYLSALENGKQNPSIRVLYRLAAAIGVHVSDLLTS